MNSRVIAIVVLLVVVASSALSVVRYHKPEGSHEDSWIYGRIFSVRGEALTSQLWRKMKVLDYSYSPINSYIMWLREALIYPSEVLEDNLDYLRVFDSKGFKAEAPDGPGVFKLGVIDLPFGGSLVVTAYSQEGRIHFVVHGLISGYKQWNSLLLSTAFLLGGPYSSGGNWFSLENNYPLVTGDLGFSYKGVYGFPVRSGWVLWRINLTGDSFILSRDRLHVINSVYVLLEMPVYKVYRNVSSFKGWVEWWQAEAMYWSVVGYPALSLAVNLAYAGGLNALSFYTSIPRVIDRSVVLNNVSYLYVTTDYFHSTPLRLRWEGAGVCNEQSRASAMFASNALGVPSAYAGVGRKLQHAVSIEIIPSSFYGRTGSIVLPFDSDRDSSNDTGVVIVDTAHMKPSVLSKNIVWWYSIPEMPLAYSDILESLRNFWLGLYSYNPLLKHFIWRKILESRYLVYLTLVPLEVSRLPSWLEMPWESLVLNTTGYNPVYNTLKGVDMLGKLWYIGSVKRQLILASIAGSGKNISPADYGFNHWQDSPYKRGFYTRGCNWSITPPPTFVFRLFRMKLSAAISVNPPPSMRGIWKKVSSSFLVGNFSGTSIPWFDGSLPYYWELTCTKRNRSILLVSTVPWWNVSLQHEVTVSLEEYGPDELEGHGIVNECPVRVIAKGLNIGWVMYVYINNKIAGEFYLPALYVNNTVIIPCHDGLIRLTALYDKSVVHVNPQVFSLNRSLTLFPIYIDNGGLRRFIAYKGFVVVRGENLTVELDYAGKNVFMLSVFLDGETIHTGSKYILEDLSYVRPILFKYHGVRIELNPNINLNDTYNGLIKLNASQVYTWLNVKLGNGSVARLKVNRLSGTDQWKGIVVAVGGWASWIWGSIRINLTGLPIYPYSISSYIITKGYNISIPLKTSYKFVDGVLQVDLHYSLIRPGKTIIPNGCCLLVRLEPINMSLEIKLP